MSKSVLMEVSEGGYMCYTANKAQQTSLPLTIWNASFHCTTLADTFFRLHHPPCQGTEFWKFSTTYVWGCHVMSMRMGHYNSPAWQWILSIQTTTGLVAFHLQWMFELSDKIHTASCTYVHVLSLCHLYSFTGYLKSHQCELPKHHRSTIFYPHIILFEIHRVLLFFCSRMLIFTDFIQSPIIFFVTWPWKSKTSYRFSTPHPRFSVVSPNEKMCSSPPEVGLLFYLCTKSKLSTFSICNIQLPNRYGLRTFMQSLMSECIALF
jgi:hypothetical protein